MSVAGKVCIPRVKWKEGIIHKKLFALAVEFSSLKKEEGNFEEQRY